MILVVGQNSTWQKTYFFDSVDRGKVNRTRDAKESAAGKGANVGRVLGMYGIEHLVLAYNGGANGAKFESDCRGDGVGTSFTAIAGETRICVTLIESDRVVTELVEAAPSITDEERSAYHDNFYKQLGNASFLCISGTAMTGESDDCYLDFARAAHEAGIPVLLDSYKTHGARALEANPEILKINADELGSLTGRPVDSPDERAAACAEVRRRYGVRWCIISRGDEGAEGFTEAGAVSARPPKIDSINPIGSGDSVSAGVLSVIEAAGKPFAEISGNQAVFEKAVVEGVAAGTANCLNWKPAAIDTGELATVRSGIELKRL